MLTGMRSTRNPYAERYEQPDWKKLEGKRKPGREGAQKRADLLGMAGTFAPIAGGLLGAGIGTAIAPGIGTAAGGAIGGGIGQLVGAGANMAADDQTKEYDEEEAKRRERYAAVQSILGGMR